MGSARCHAPQTIPNTAISKKPHEHWARGLPSTGYEAGSGPGRGGGGPPHKGGNQPSGRPRREGSVTYGDRTSFFGVAPPAGHHAEGGRSDRQLLTGRGGGSLKAALRWFRLGRCAGDSSVAVGHQRCKGPRAVAEQQRRWLSGCSRASARRPAERRGGPRSVGAPLLRGGCGVGGGGRLVRTPAGVRPQGWRGRDECGVVAVVGGRPAPPGDGEFVEARPWQPPARAVGGVAGFPLRHRRLARCRHRRGPGFRLAADSRCGLAARPASVLGRTPHAPLSRGLHQERASRCRSRQNLLVRDRVLRSERTSLPREGSRESAATLPGSARSPRPLVLATAGRMLSGSCGPTSSSSAPKAVFRPGRSWTGWLGRGGAVPGGVPDAAYDAFWCVDPRPDGRPAPASATAWSRPSSKRPVRVSPVALHSPDRRRRRVPAGRLQLMPEPDRDAVPAVALPGSQVCR
jgi:hypothetical protein